MVAKSEVIDVSKPGVLESKLRMFRPHVVILYEPDLYVVRTLECYCAEINGKIAPPDMHIFEFDRSIEKFRFEESVQHENMAFDALINNKKHLMVNLDTITKLQNDDVEGKNQSTRQGKGVLLKKQLGKEIQPKVIVDMREFRCPLPQEMYAQGLKVVCGFEFFN